MLRYVDTSIISNRIHLCGLSGSVLWSVDGSGTRSAVCQDCPVSSGAWLFPTRQSSWGITYRYINVACKREAKRILKGSMPSRWNKRHLYWCVTMLSARSICSVSGVIWNSGTFKALSERPEEVRFGVWNVWVQPWHMCPSSDVGWQHRVPYGSRSSKGLIYNDIHI